MRVAVVSPWYPSARHRTEGVFVRNEVAALQQVGVDVLVIHLCRELPAGQVRLDGVAETETQYAGADDGVPIIRLGMHPADPLSVMRAAPRLAKCLENIDVVHSHAISALPIMRLAHKHKKKPWIHSEHWSALANPQTASPLLQLVRPGFGLLLKFPDIVLAESERLAVAVQKFRGNKLTQIIPCIVSAPEKLIERHQNLGDELWLTSTGGVIERKNPKLAIEMVAELQKYGIKAHLRWSGVGELMDECRQLAAYLNVDCEFLGTQTPQQVQAEIARADFFVAPTRGDNFFVAAAEALVNGRPLLASDQGGHVEYADAKYSEIVAEQTPSAYAAGLLQLRDKAAGISASEISASVAVRFAPETVAAQLLDTYNAALKLRQKTT